MTVLLGLSNRIIFKRCLWVSGLPGAHIKYTSLSSEEHSQVRHTQVHSSDCKRAKNELAFGHTMMVCLSYQKRRQRESVHCGDSRKNTKSMWKLIGGGTITYTLRFQKGSVFTWKVSYVLQEKKQNQTTVKRNICQHLRQQKISTTKNFQELFSECLPTKCGFFA